jgi:hypothetical protein
MIKQLAYEAIVWALSHLYQFVSKGKYLFFSAYCKMPVRLSSFDVCKMSLCKNSKMEFCETTRIIFPRDLTNHVSSGELSEYDTNSILSVLYSMLETENQNISFLTLVTDYSRNVSF